MVQGDSSVRKTSKSCLKILEKLSSLFDPLGVDWSIKRVNFKDVLLIDRIMSIFDIVEDKSDFVSSTCYDFSLEERIVPLQDLLQLTFLLTRKRLEHILWAIHNENSGIFLWGFKVGCIITETQVIKQFFNVF